MGFLPLAFCSLALRGWSWLCQAVSLPNDSCPGFGRPEISKGKERHKIHSASVPPITQGVAQAGDTASPAERGLLAQGVGQRWGAPAWEGSRGVPSAWWEAWEEEALEVEALRGWEMEGNQVLAGDCPQLLLQGG